jgi:diacylglycerol kinase
MGISPPEDDEFQPTERSWKAKFRDALVGIALGIRGQSSFRVHLLCALLAVAAGAVLRIDRIEWCLVVLCITAVLAAELFNSALERMAKAIDRRHNPELGAALDIASGAVLLAAVGAVAVGAAVFVFRFGVLVKWWTA